VADHPCPGCQAPGVPHSQLACKPCWWRLPKHLRDAVNSGYRVRVRNPRIHREALAAALAWYRDNPAVSR
jgi:hypothetical protein